MASRPFASVDFIVPVSVAVSTPRPRIMRFLHIVSRERPFLQKRLYKERSRGITIILLPRCSVAHEAPLSIIPANKIEMYIVLIYTPYVYAASCTPASYTGHLLLVK